MLSISNLKNIGSLGVAFAKVSNVIEQFLPSDIIGLVQWLFKEESTNIINGEIVDHGPRDGDSRPVQPGRCLVLNGTDQYVLLDSIITLTGDCYIEGQFKFGTLAKSILGHSSINSFIRVSATSVRAYVGGAISDIALSSTLVTNQYYKIKFERIGSTGYIYIDGVLKGSNTISTNDIDFDIIGGRNTSIELFDGDFFGVNFNDEHLYKCDEGDGFDVLDSLGDIDGVFQNPTLPDIHGTQDIYSWQNEVGYSDGTGAYDGVLIPRDESNTALDVLGNPLQYSGQCPFNAKPVQMPCGTFDSVDDAVRITTGSALTDFVFTTKFRLDSTSNPRFFGSAGTGVARTAGSSSWGFSPSGNNWFFTVKTTDLELNTDYRITFKVIQNGSDVDYAIILDGVTVLSGTRVGGTLNHSSSYIDIGRYSQTFSGIIWDTRLYTADKTNEQIENYNLADLYFWLPFNGNFDDVSGNARNGIPQNITELDFWANTQDDFAYGLIFENQTGVFNGTSKIARNYGGAPVLIQAGIPQNDVIEIGDDFSLLNPPYDYKDDSDKNYGNEIVVNGGFDSDLSDWNVVVTTNTVEWSDGSVRFDIIDSTLTRIDQDILEVGSDYECSFDVSITRAGEFIVGIGEGASLRITESGHYVFRGVPMVSLFYIKSTTPYTGEAYFDNISVKKYSKTEKNLLVYDNEVSGADLTNLNNFLNK